jgi:benzoate/toluate 1,2-dioxygenase subunit beta
VSEIELHHAAEQFLFKEARLLDTNNWREWQTLFTSDAIYWVPSSVEDYDPELHISIIYDGPAALNDRLARLESGRAYSQDPPSRTVHHFSNVSVERQGDRFHVRSTLILCEFRPNSQRRDETVKFHPASCEYVLVGRIGNWKMASKKVVLLASDGTFLDLSFLI